MACAGKKCQQSARLSARLSLPDEKGGAVSIMAAIGNAQ
jgi:hypothetical protein